MIYLITGVPGSGKTLYAVSTLIQKLAAEKITGKNGKETTRRVCVDGIKDLIFPHEMMAERPDDGAFAVPNSKNEVIPASAGNGLWNWPDWCQPGDLIVVDEVQRYWRPRGMGVKPPYEIQALETHRHKGVDFIIITQNPMLIDQNVRRLVGRHQNIRRLFGMGRALVYDWDGCSVDVNRTKGATTTLWGYPKNAYKLYKSSELHTKQRQKIPLWVALPVVALVAGVLVAPKAYSTMSGAMSGKGVTQVAPASPVPILPVALPSLVPVSPMVAVAASVPVATAPGAIGAEVVTAAVSPPEPAGCFQVAKKCGCMDVAGKPVQVEPGFCESHILGNAVPGQKLELSPAFQNIPDLADIPDNAEKVAMDLSVYAFLGRHR